MYVLFNKSNVNWYLINAISILLILIIAFVGQRSKRGIVPGAVITRMTMSSEEKWKQVNRFRSKLAYILFVPLLLIDITLYIINRQRTYAFTLSVIIAIIVFAYFIILTIYTDVLERKWLSEQKKEGHPASDFEFVFPGIPKKRLISGTLIVGAIVVVLFLLQFVLFKGY